MRESVGVLGAECGSARVKFSTVERTLEFRIFGTKSFFK